MEEVVRDLIAKNPEWVPDRIYAELTKAAQQAKIPVTQLPSSRTIARIKGRFPPEERSAYGFVRWPETFEIGLLGWDAAPGLLREMALFEGFGKRMTVRWASWWERLWRSAPDAPLAELQSAAGALAAMEVLGGVPEDRRRALEVWLAYHGWDASEASPDRRPFGKNAYIQAAQHSGFEPWDSSYAVPVGGGLDAIVDALTEFSMLTREQARSVLDLMGDRAGSGPDGGEGASDAK